MREVLGASSLGFACVAASPLGFDQRASMIQDHCVRLVGLSPRFGFNESSLKEARS
jgi:hypothetical protein